MNATRSPLVSILTPVFNGADHLAECIESVLAQTYSNWDYTIVNNCSTDDSLAIAQKYADDDARIRIVNNNHHLNIFESHNYTSRQLSPESKYCKFVFADDWIYPACIEELVRAAEQNPSVGLVGAYTMDGASVRWHGPLYPCHRLSGREACRRQLLGGPYVFGTMTSLLVRSDLIRKRGHFFKDEHLQADLEACFDLLQESDFSFVHQVLSFSRERKQATDSLAANLNSQRLADFVVFLEYGPQLLNEPEYLQRWKTVRRQYYRVLAHNVLRLRPRQFWRFHQNALTKVGTRINPWLLAVAVLTELAVQLTNPMNAFTGAWYWWSRRVRRWDGRNVDELRESAPAAR